MSNFYGFAKKHTSNSGGAWGTNVSPTCGWRLEYSDATYDGLPVQGMSGAPSADRVYSTREHGVIFTVPPYAKLNVRGLAFFVRRSGTPTGTMRMKLYTGASPTLQGTTYDLPLAALPSSGSNGWVYAYFASDLTLNGGDVVRITLAESTNSDSSSNYYSPYEVTVEDTDPSRSLGPMEGTWQKTYYNGSTWTETPAIWVPAALLLDTAGEFAQQSAGGPGGRPLVMPERVYEAIDF